MSDFLKSACKFVFVAKLGKDYSLNLTELEQFWREEWGEISVFRCASMIQTCSHRLCAAIRASNKHWLEIWDLFCSVFSCKSVYFIETTFNVKVFWGMFYFWSKKATLYWSILICKSNDRVKYPREWIHFIMTAVVLLPSLETNDRKSASPHNFTQEQKSANANRSS